MSSSFVDRCVIMAQVKEDAGYITIKLMEYWRWDRNMNILKAEYLDMEMTYRIWKEKVTFKL